MVKLQYIEMADFWDDINSKKKELIYEIINQIITHIESESKKRKLKIFEIHIKDDYIVDFSISKGDMFDTLENLLPDMIKYEEFEICSKIKMICGL